MRTALILLLLLAVASVAGSLIPQIPNSPEKVAQYMGDHPLVATFYLHAGLFDVFGSWWFELITALLFISLFACLLPRTRASFRSVRERPKQAREIDSFPRYVERRVTVAPEAALASSRQVLRRRWFRVADGDGQLAAEKGAARELGSLMFHWAFVLVLVGVAVGKGTGYVGHATVIEGQTWVDAQANYQGQLRTGRFFSGDFSGIGIHLTNFEDTFRSSGIPMDFVSHVQLLDPAGNVARTTDIRVNQPAHFDGMNIFQYGFGWAPVVEIRQGDKLLSSGPIAFGQVQPPAGVPALALPWLGTDKVSEVTPNVGVTMQLWPDAFAFVQSQATGQPVLMTQARKPFIKFSSYAGPILDPATSTGLDTTPMKRQSSGFLGLGDTVDLATGRTLKPDPATGKVDYGDRLTISFPSLREYTTLQISRDRGVPIVLLAAILILLGLLPALYTSRRKVWVRVESADEGALLKVGGFSLQRKSQFDEEFRRLVEALVRACGGEASVSRKEKVGTA